MCGSGSAGVPAAGEHGVELLVIAWVRFHYFGMQLSRSMLQVELTQDVLDMNFGGALTDHQRGRDLAIALPCASNSATSRSRPVSGSSESANERSARAGAGASDRPSSSARVAAAG